MISDFILTAAEETPVAGIIISITEMMFFGYLATRITKRLKLPNVTAYIVTGILLGPYCLHTVPGSGISVYSVSFTISSAELKKYKSHQEIIDALGSLEYVIFIEEMR